MTQANFERARAVLEAGDAAGLRKALVESPDLVHATNQTATGTELHATLLHYATFMPGMNPPDNAVELIELLIEAGADVNARSAPVKPKFAGETPLHWAAGVGSKAMIDALVAASAELDAGGGVLFNGSPLLLAALFGRHESAIALLQHGAAYNILIAASVGRLDLVREFFDEARRVRPGAYSLPCWGDFDESPQVALDDSFWNACCRGHLDVAKFLAERGANPAEIGPTGTTPLDEAREHGHTEVAQWLREILGSGQSPSQ